MDLYATEPRFTGRTWTCQVVDRDSGATVAETFGASRLEAECKAIGAVTFGNSRAARSLQAGGQGS